MIGDLVEVDFVNKALFFYASKLHKIREMRKLVESGAGCRSFHWGGECEVHLEISREEA